MCSTLKTQWLWEGLPAVSKHSTWTTALSWGESATLGEMEAQECADIPRWKASDSADFKLIPVLQASDSQHPAPVLTQDLEDAHTERNSQHSTKSLTSPSPRERQGGAGTSVPTCMTQQGCSLWTGPCSPAAHRRSLGELQSCAGPSLPTHSFNTHVCVCNEYRHKCIFIYIYIYAYLS